MKTSRMIMAAVLLLFASILHGQTINKVINGFSSGDATSIAANFSNNIEFFVNNSDNIYTKSQAESILSSFFQKNSPKNFTVIHQGTKNMSQFVIGKLKTSTKTFRVYFLVKDNIIQQLRIEDYDE